MRTYINVSFEIPILKFTYDLYQSIESLFKSRTKNTDNFVYARSNECYLYT